MSSLRLSHLLQQFFRHGLPCLPVVEADGDRFLGFVMRGDIDRAGADIERLQQEHARIPASLLHGQISEESMHALVEKAPVPVLDTLGRECQRWDRPELYRRLATLEEEEKRSQTEARVEPVNAEPTPSQGDWLSQLILSCLPHPLLATDLNGHTLFYNETFVRRILERGPFKNTLALAERYFLEVNRTALARTYSMGPHPVDLLFVSLPELHLTVEIATLELDRVVMGYLYIIHDPEVMGLPHEIMSRLEAGMDLDSIMEDMEAGIIASMLRRTGQNVSHAAKALGVNRSTLQNKIRRLDVNERFHRKVEGPVRRIRRKTSDVAEMIIPEAKSFVFDSVSLASADLTDTETANVPEEKGKKVKVSQAVAKGLKKDVKAGREKGSGKAPLQTAKQAAASASIRAAKKSGNNKKA